MAADHREGHARVAESRRADGLRDRRDAGGSPFLDEQERVQGLSLRKLFAEQEHSCDRSTPTGSLAAGGAVRDRRWGLRGVCVGGAELGSESGGGRGLVGGDGGAGCRGRRDRHPASVPGAGGEARRLSGARWRGRRGRHQLDAVAAGGDGEGSGLVPAFLFAFDLEAVLLEAGEGGVELGADDGEMGAGGDGGVVLVHQVDLGAGGFEPGEAAVERVRDLGEAEDGEELDGAVEIGGENLDAGVLEHVRVSWWERTGWGWTRAGPRTEARLMPPRPRSRSTR